MKLKGIQLQGFKSFKNKTKLDFQNPITGIVGPNGSGKSNISDAVRWVLGESSAKQMRAERMEEIIFAGTDEVKPLNFCEVSMTFDNSDAWIPIDYDEVVVARRVFRTGESEYYLNKTRSRRKDIRELFLNTGIGKEGYSIIGQGRIQEILTSKPEERRLIFEEASGIARHKYKKEESMKRLEKTKDNIQRLEDILTEQRKRVAYLEKEADKAQQALDLEEKIKEGTLFYSHQELEAIQAGIKGQQEVLTHLEAEVEEREGLIASRKEKLVSLQKDLLEAEKKELYLRERKQELALEKQRLLSSLEIKKENRRFENIRQGEREEEVLYQEKKIKDLEEKQGEVELLLEEQGEKLQALDQEQELAKEELAKMKAKNGLQKEEEKKSRERIEGLEEQRQALYIKKTAKEQISLDFQERQRQWSEEAKQQKNKLEELEQRQAQFERREKKLSEDLAKKESQLALEKKTLAEGERNLGKLELLGREKQKQMESLKNRYQFYQKVQDSYEGYYHNVKLLFQRVKGTPLEKKIIGSLAELITVEEGFEKVIDTLLYSNLQNIVVASSKEAAELINFLKKERIGSCTFLPIANMRRREALKVQDPRIIKLASQAVSGPEEIRGIIEFFLNQTAIVANIQEANDLSRKYPHRFRIATLDGDLINTSGAMIGGFRGKQRDSGLINRQKELEKLSRELDEAVRVYQELEADYFNKKSNLAQGKEAYELGSQALRRMEEESQGARQDLALLRQEINHEVNKYEEIKKNLQQAEQASFTRQDQLLLDQIELELQAAKARMATLAEGLEKDLQQERQQEDRCLQAQMDREIAQRDSLLSENKLLEIKDELKERKGSLERHFQEKENFSKRSQELEEEMREEEKKLARLEEEASLVRDKYPLAQQEWKELKELYEEESQGLQKLEHDQVEEQFERERRKERLGQVYEKRQALVEKIKEDYQVDLFLSKPLASQMTKEELQAYRRKRQVLGYVSLDSIEEYQEVKEESDFLQAQKEDLIQSKRDLKEVIHRLDFEMTQTFIDAFEEINKSFQEIFVLLFSGGQAELVLEKGDILTAGVEIIARPPGKKRQSLNLLSGGEKALTAVALLFALFNTNPSPFCILDEIDASLDEANIYRYTNYLKTISHETQFIMITHRKTTMEICDSLFGVSMQEEGISTVVPLAFEDYQEVK